VLGATTLRHERDVVRDGIGIDLDRGRARHAEAPRPEAAT
jgi:hypothetical protein